jgi:hypothetical protein
VFAATAFSREVAAALRVEAGDIQLICGEEILGDGAVPSVCCQCLNSVHRGCYSLYEESL